LHIKEVYNCKVVVEALEDSSAMEMWINVTLSNKKNAKIRVDLMSSDDECPHKTKVSMFNLITYCSI
jgi:hypothetical protein